MSGSQRPGNSAFLQEFQSPHTLFPGLLEAAGFLMPGTLPCVSCAPAARSAPALWQDQTRGSRQGHSQDLWQL